MFSRYHAAFGSIAAIMLSASFVHAQRNGMQAPMLAKGKDYLVHAVPQDEGYIVTHTVPSTGVMKRLVMSVPPAAENEAKASARRVARPAVVSPTVRIAAAAADDERLYVLLHVDGLARRGVTISQPAGSHFRLQAFLLTDGAPLLGPNGYAIQTTGADNKEREERSGRARSRLSRASFRRNEESKEAPQESVVPGPLKLDENSVSFNGTTVEFDGRKVTNLKLGEREFMPPPGFFDERRFMR